MEETRISTENAGIRTRYTGAEKLYRKKRYKKNNRLRIQKAQKLTRNLHKFLQKRGKLSPISCKSKGRSHKPLLSDGDSVRSGRENKKLYIFIIKPQRPPIYKTLMS